MIAKVFTKSNKVSLLLFAFLLWGGASELMAQKGPVNTKRGVAIQGYDAVSYFQGKASEGDARWSSKWEGNTYRFSSAENKALFEANPQKYLPQYGGFCAYAMAVKGDKVAINPKTFEIRDGKLYLFYNKWINNTFESWQEEGPEKLVVQADKNWKAHLK